MKTMLNTVSKIYTLNVLLYDVIKMSTSNPAKEVKRPDLGHLSVGAVADVAVMREDQGVFGFADSSRARYTGSKLLVCELTLREGNVAWDLNGRAGSTGKTRRSGAGEEGDADAAGDNEQPKQITPAGHYHENQPPCHRTSTRERGP